LAGKAAAGFGGMEGAGPARLTPSPRRGTTQHGPTVRVLGPWVGVCCGSRPPRVAACTAKTGQGRP
jgi:hypothetical protein